MGKRRVVWAIAPQKPACERQGAGPRTAVERVAVRDPPGGHAIDDCHRHKGARGQSVLDGPVEQIRFAQVYGQLKPRLDRSCVIGRRRWLLTDDAGLAPRAILLLKEVHALSDSVTLQPIRN